MQTIVSEHQVPPAFLSKPECKFTPKACQYMQCQCQCQSKIFNVARIAELLRSSRRRSRVTELRSAKTAKKERFKTLTEDADDRMSDGNEFQRSDVSDLQFYKILFAVCNVTPFSQNNCYLFQCLMLSFNVFLSTRLT